MAPEFIDISVPLNFDGPQPNAFGAARASFVTLGDTRTGSGVNYEQYTLTPHCNGTHTECIGHITNERVFIRECLRDVFISAFLISVHPETAPDGDLLITAEALRSANLADGRGREALIVRTLPNDRGKLERQYAEDAVPAYFTQDAMEEIVISGFTHILTDLPSIDRLYDGGKLLNHRIFWKIPEGAFAIYADSRIYSTITEIVFVPDEVADGNYELNLQIAPFQADAAPSRPLLFPAGTSIGPRAQERV